VAKVKVVGILSHYVGGRGEIEVEGGRSIGEILEGLGIPPALVGIVLLNGKQVEKSHRIEEGDEVKLIPLLGGGKL